MGLSLADRLATPTGRTASFYATFYMSQAVANPFLPIWLKQQGISAEQIGIVNALPIFVMIVLNVVVGRLADRAKDWRSVIIAGACIAALAPVLLLFAGGNYWAILLLWAWVIIPFQAIGPVVDASTYRLARRIGADFGAMRVWGTIGFVAVTLISGFLLDWHGAAAFLPLLAGVSIIRAITSFQLPLLRGEPNEQAANAAAKAPNPLIATTLRQIWRPWFFLPLLGAALLHGSHMMQMGFGALIWQEAGLSGWVIGVLWAVAPAGEILVMWFFEPITRRIRARHLILIACIGGTIRWWGFGLEPGPWALAGFQVLHMVSFAFAYAGIVNFIGKWTSENIAASAQSFFSMLRQIVTVFSLTGFGYLVAHVGAGAYYVAALMASVGALMTLASLILMNPRQER